MELDGLNIYLNALSGFMVIFLKGIRHTQIETEYEPIEENHNGGFKNDSPFCILPLASSLLFVPLSLLSYYYIFFFYYQTL